MKYVAFLRGINVGGNKKVPMQELKEVLERAGVKNVCTLLNSGNVVYEGKVNVQNILEKHFGFSIPTLVFPFSFLEEVVEKAPFKEGKALVTFSKAKVSAIPVQKNGFHLLGSYKHATFSEFDPKVTGTVASMKILEEVLGEEITTRTFTTIKKLVLL